MSFRRLLNCYLNKTKFEFIILPEHCSNRISFVGNHLCLILLTVCLISAGGFLKSFCFIANQVKSSVVVSFESRKNAHFDSTLRYLNNNLNESIGLLHGVPKTIIDCRINIASIPELIRNSSLLSLGMPNSIDELFFTNEFQYRIPSKPPSRRKKTSDLLIFSCPSEGRITSHFGKRTDPVFEGTAIHYGIDIATRVGTPILAAAAGKVKFTGNKNHWGNVIIVDHIKGYQTIYAHLHKCIISSGDTVSKGQILGYSGNTGKSTGPHLHYEIRYFGKPLNPLPFLLPGDQIAD